MKIALVTPEFVTEPSFAGGLANYLARIAAALSGQGHEVHVVVRSEEDGQELLNGVRIHRVRCFWQASRQLDHLDPLVPRRLYSSYQDIKGAYALFRYWRHLDQAGRFDVVQLANVSASGLFFPPQRPGVVVRLSSYRPLWDRLAGMPKTLDSVLRWRLEERMIRRFSSLFAPTRFLAQLAEKHFARLSVPVIQSPFFLNPVSSEVPEQAALLRSQGQFCLFFGRLTQMKGVHILAQAFRIVLQTFPKARLALVGHDGVSPDRSGMKEHLRKVFADCAGSVSILPALPHTELYPIIRASRFVVLPSLVDNMPNACLEAIGLGKPVVATQGSCFEEFLDPPATGPLVAPGNVDELVTALEQMWMASAQDLDRMSWAARQAAARLHPSRTVPKLVAYYEAASSGICRR